MRRAGFAAVALAALAASPAAMAQSDVPLVSAVPSIAVTGDAKRDVPPDVASIRIGVVTDRATAAQATQDNAKASQALVAAAHAAGVEDVDIRTADLSLSAIADQKDASRINAYRANDTVIVKVRDLARVGALIAALTGKGANSLDGVDFQVADTQPVLDALEAEATQDARRRADIYAKAAGVKLGRILRIMPLTTSPAPMMRALKMQVADVQAAPPVQPGTEEIRARVEITWELVP